MAALDPMGPRTCTRSMPKGVQFDGFGYGADMHYVVIDNPRAEADAL